MYEAREIVKCLIYVDKNQRELDRYKLYVAIQSNSKNKIDLESVMKLPWDKSEMLKDKPIEYNEEEEKRLNDKAKYYENLLSSGQLKFN